jgi:hypothetical protein
MVVVSPVALFEFHEIFSAGDSSISGHTFTFFVSENRIIKVNVCAIEYEFDCLLDGGHFRRVAWMVSIQELFCF